MPPPFPVCPRAGAPQIDPVRRLLALAVLHLAGASLALGADGVPARFNVVEIKPASTSLFIATVSMTFAPFVRHRTVFASTYAARVFPYFFYSEKGRIWIVVNQEALGRASRGQPAEFTGHALSDSGSDRKVEGKAVPTGPTTGTIKVRVFISRRIILVYNTTYELMGPAEPPSGVTPTPAR